MTQDVPQIFSDWRFLCITEVASRCVQGCNIYGDFNANKAKQKRIHFLCSSNPASTKWYGKHKPLILINYRILQGSCDVGVCMFMMYKSSPIAESPSTPRYYPLLQLTSEITFHTWNLHGS